MLPRGAGPSRTAPQRLGLPGRTGRGASMNNTNNKPQIPGRGGGRGGSFTGTGRGGGLALRGHGSRGNFGNRRGSFTGPFQGMRGRGQSHHNLGRNRHEPPKDSTISPYGKREENRRTLTDFKIIGLEIPDLEWQWGTVPTLKIESEQTNSLQPESSEEESSKVEANSPPSRIRIYFHTPVTPDDSHPISHPSLSTIPSDSRKGKRKKLEDDDPDTEDGARERPPPHMSDDLSSVAPSVSESAGEDWLMAAIAASEKTESDHAEDEDDQPADSVQLADNASEGVVEDFLHSGELLFLFLLFQVVEMASLWRSRSGPTANLQL